MRKEDKGRVPAPLRIAAALALAAGLALAPAAAAPARALTSAQTVTMVRLYNPWTGEHLYTSSLVEIDLCVDRGWRKEGAAWVAPATSSTPVYRLYNPYSGDHHYTVSKEEYDGCAKQGWRKEGVAWYSADSRSVAVYRGYNPYETVGTHHYTTGRDEMSSMVKAGWRAEGVAWYALKWVEDEPARDERVWVEDAAAYDEAVYEEVDYLECSRCSKRFYEYKDNNAMSQLGVHQRDAHAQDAYWCKTCGEVWPDTEEGFQAMKRHDQEVHPDQTRGLSYRMGTEKVRTGTVHHDAEGHWETVRRGASGHWE